MFSSDVGVTVRLIPIDRWELTRNYYTLIVPPKIPIVYKTSNRCADINLILVDPARGYCYRGPTKPCELRGESPQHTAQ